MKPEVVAVLAQSAGARSRWIVRLALLSIVALAFGLRMYRLGDQSVWYDEFISVSHVDEPDLATCLRLQRVANWNLAPVYYTLQYFWANTLTDSIVGLRFLSILFGMAAIPLIYLVGRDLFGRNAGLVAALLLALSPAHLYQAQELRNYAVSMFFALLSAYTFVRVLRGGGLRWWGAHLLANTLLIWTHLFGVFLLLPEGCFLLLFRWRDVRRTGAWVLAHLLLMAPLYFWVRDLTINPPSCGPPRPWMIPGNLFLDCLSVTWAPGVVAGIPWQNAPPAWMDYLKRVYGAAEWLHPAAFFAAILVLVGWAAGRARRLSAEGKAEEKRGVLERTAFPLLWLFVPVLVVFALTRLWRPDIFSAKYTNWASLAAYLMVGGAVAALPRIGLRRIAVAVFVLLYAYRLAFAFTYPQRTEWNAAARHIRQYAAPNDTVVLSSWVQEPVFRYAMGATSLPIASATGFVELCGKMEARLEKGQGVWGLMAGRFDDFLSLERLERYFSLRHIPYTTTGFMGMQPILMIHAVPGAPLRVPGAPLRAPGADYRPAGDPAAIAALRQDLATRGEDVMLRTWLAHLLDKAGDHEAALEEYRRARPNLSGDAEAREVYLRALEQAGRFKEALAFFHAHRTLESARDYAHLAKLEAQAGDGNKAIQTYQDGLARHPGDALLHVDLGVAFAVAGRTEEAIAEYRKSIDLAPNRPWAYLSLARLLEAKGHYTEAVEQYRNAAAQPPLGNGGRMGLAQILEKMGKHTEAQAAYGQAIAERPDEGHLGVSVDDPDYFEAAAEGHRGAIAAEPAFFLYYNELDALYVLRGDMAGRIAELRRLATRYPDAARAHFHLGLALLAAHEAGEACAALRRATELEPRDWTMQVNLGLALAQAGEFEAAEEAFRAARDLAPAQGHVRVILIETLLAARAFDEARTEMDTCKRLGVELPPELVKRITAGEADEKP